MDETENMGERVSIDAHQEKTNSGMHRAFPHSVKVPFSILKNPSSIISKLHMATVGILGGLRHPIDPTGFSEIYQHVVTVGTWMRESCILLRCPCVAYGQEYLLLHLDCRGILFQKISCEKSRPV